MVAVGCGGVVGLVGMKARGAVFFCGACLPGVVVIAAAAAGGGSSARVELEL